jgi:uncharacterized protein
MRADAAFCTSCGMSSDGLIVADRPIERILREAEGSARLFKRTVLFYALWLLSGVVMAFAVGDDNFVEVAIVVGTLDLVLTFAWAMAQGREVMRLYMPGRAALPYLVAVAGAWPIAFAVHMFVSSLESVMEASRITEPFFARGWGWGALIAVMCMQPAVVEELAFRGVIQTSVAGLMRPVEAVFVAAVAFSIMHFSPVMFVPFVLLGAYLGMLRLWSDSLWPAMLAHFLHNLIVTVHEVRPLFPI